MKIKISKSQWEEMGKVSGWEGNQPLTHKEIMMRKRPSRPCNSHDIILVKEGLQCGNCLALTRDHGKTWESAK